MAIYDFPSMEKGTSQAPPKQERGHVEPLATLETGERGVEKPPASFKGQIFSAITARLLFLLLLAADFVWTCYSVAVFIFSIVGFSASGGKVPFFKNLFEKTWVSLRRSMVCGVSLMVALFSPAFGVMIACTYFLMYDKAGIEEVIPSSLQSQFKEFLPQKQPE